MGTILLYHTAIATPGDMDIVGNLNFLLLLIGGNRRFNLPAEIGYGEVVIL